MTSEAWAAVEVRGMARRGSLERPRVWLRPGVERSQNKHDRGTPRARSEVKREPSHRPGALARAPRVTMSQPRQAAWLLASALVLSAGLAAAVVVGWVSETQIIRMLIMAAVLLGVAVLARLAARSFTRPAPAPVRRTSFPVDPPARIAQAIDEACAAPQPDATRIVDYLLFQAAAAQASDIHVVPYRDYTTVRLRLDGVMTDVARLTPRVTEQVTNRLKVLAQAVTYVHDRPQDGRFDFDTGTRPIDLRVAFMPTLHGERVVLRLLDRAEVELGLQGLGLSEAQLALLNDLLSRPQGLLVLTGPTGSGKTTTIYCALRAILDQTGHSSSIYTLEDPIEYDLLNINQTQIEEGQGFTFAAGLRTMLRSDPDVIMVGEVRDLDTARIAVQAGMTGHMIITTVHAQQAAGVFMRLIEMGVDSHSVAAAVTASVAQRLVRLLCLHCKREAPATPGQEAKLGRDLRGGRYYVPVGCPKCGLKGYLGRRGVFEILGVDEALRGLIVERASPERVQRAAVKNGMTTLVDNGLALAQRGETSLDEVIRMLPREERAA
jgi:general secretion pathway protein E